MKIKKISLILLLAVLASSLLSACAGGAGVPSSWPGLLVDGENDVVYMALNTHVYAINLSNGTEKWRFPAKPDNKLSFFAAPTLDDNGKVVAGAYNHEIYSIDSENGQQTWAFNEATDKYVGPALASGGLIYAPNVDYILYALGSNGSLRWTFESEQALWAKPLTDGKRVYVASMDHHIYAVDPENGEKVWSTEDLGGAVMSSFVLSPDGILYVGTLGSAMVAVDSSNGKILWKTAVKNWVWSKPVLANGAIYFADQDGNFFALDAQSGAVLWQVQPDTTPTRAVISTPVLVDNTLYFGSQGGILYAVDAANGSVLWNKTIGGKIYTDLMLAGDTILIAPLNFDAALVAVDLQGNNRWSYTPAK